MGLDQNLVYKLSALNARLSASAFYFLTPDSKCAVERPITTLMSSYGGWLSPPPFSGFAGLSRSSSGVHCAYATGKAFHLPLCLSTQQETFNMTLCEVRLLGLVVVLRWSNSCSRMLGWERGTGFMGGWNSFCREVDMASGCANTTRPCNPNRFCCLLVRLLPVAATPALGGHEAGAT